MSDTEMTAPVAVDAVRLAAPLAGRTEGRLRAKTLLRTLLQGGSPEEVSSGTGMSVWRQDELIRAIEATAPEDRAYLNDLRFGPLTEHAGWKPFLFELNQALFVTRHFECQRDRRVAHTYQRVDGRMRLDRYLLAEAAKSDHRPAAALALSHDRSRKAAYIERFVLRQRLPTWPMTMNEPTPHAQDIALLARAYQSGRPISLWLGYEASGSRRPFPNNAMDAWHLERWFSRLVIEGGRARNSPSWSIRPS